MIRKRFRMPSTSTTIAMLALFVALTSTAWAASLPKNSVGSKQIKKNAVTSAKIKSSAVASSDVKNDSLTGSDINEATLGAVPSATNAQNAAAIGANTVSSGNVTDGSLTGADVGRKAGTFVRDLPNFPAGTCDYEIVDLDPANTDLRDDALVISPDNTWPTGLIYSVEASDSPGLARLNICNPTGGAINPDPIEFRYVAFNVG